MIGYIIGLKAIISSDYVPINGAFQNYNVWRRNIEGQLPYKDFTVYLGVGHLFIGSFFTWLFGGNFTSSIFASHFITFQIGMLFILLISYCIHKDIKRALFTTLILLISCTFILKDFLISFSQELNIAISSFMYPGNSARIIRSGVIPICSLLIIKLIRGLKSKDEDKLYYMTSFFSGLSIIYSNDVGIASYISLTFIVLLTTIQNKFIFKKVIGRLFLHFLLSFFGFILGLLIFTKGNVLYWIEFTLGAGSYQRWYFNSDKIFYFSEIIGTKWIYFGLLMLLYYLYLSFKFSKCEKDCEKYLFNNVLIYIILTSIINSLFYRVVSGGNSNELLFLCLFTIIITYLFEYTYSKFKVFNLRLEMPIILLSCIIISINYFQTINTPHQGKYVSELGGYLNQYADSLEEAKIYIGDEKIFSTYASALEVMTNQYQPTGTDYIIHVLGDEARKKYIDNFNNGDYKFVQTIKSEFSGWEYWIRNSNWFFYRELLKKYEPTFATDYSLIWEKSENNNIVNDEVNIELKQLENNKYMVICRTEKAIDAIADLEISYVSKRSESFFKSGLVNHYTFVTDFAAEYNVKTPIVNHFIPNNAIDYNIPVTLTNGQGHIVIESLPKDKTTLTINNIQVVNLINNPFDTYIETSSLVDENWDKGISKSLQVLLFKNEKNMLNNLKEGHSIESNSEILEIKSIDYDENWIRVEVTPILKIENFQSPTQIKIIK